MDGHLDVLAGLLRDRWTRLRAAREDYGAVSTEAVILTFILAGLALAAGAVIVAKVMDKANSIPTQ